MHLLLAFVITALPCRGLARRVQTDTVKVQPKEKHDDAVGGKGVSSLLLSPSRATTVRASVHASPSKQANALARESSRVHDSPASKVSWIRGGGAPSMMLGSVIQAFTMPSVLGAWSIAVVPCALAYIRQAYVFSLSYGLATAAIGGVILSSSCPITNTWVFIHAALILGYGLRLFAFLFWRQVGQDAGYGGADGKLAQLDKTPRSQRTSLILSTAFFYALMCCPLLYHAQVGTAALRVPFGKHILATGAGLAGFGLFVEALADLQKSLFKIRLRAAGAADRLCTEGLYAVCRHPNYLGEILFWIGSCILGLPAIFAQASSLPVWQTIAHAVFSGLGLFGIVMIMISATKRLDGRQEANAPEKWPQLGKDGELDSYAKYKSRTFKLFPWQR